MISRSHQRQRGRPLGPVGSSCLDVRPPGSVRGRRMALRIESDLVVDLKRIDEGHQPSQQLLVGRMIVVGVEDGSVGELHDAPKLVSLRSGRDVMTHQGLDKTWNLTLK